MKKYKNSVIIGKFMPPHYGHIFMIETALVYSETVHLMVYTMKSEPINGELRYLSLGEHFYDEPNLRIYFIEKDLPQQPDEHPDFWNIWKNEISGSLDVKIDCFFGSEGYVNTLGELFNCDTNIVDIDRITVPISGTKCRDNFNKKWEWIIPEFRKYLVKKVCFVGGESTGKSVLTKTISKIFKTNYVEEYGRSYCDIKPPSTFTTNDFTYISKIQSENVSFSLIESNKILFCDTDAIVTQAFHILYLGKESEEINKIIEKDEYDYYFLLSPDIEFEQDGTREFSDKRDLQFTLLKELLKKWDRKFTIITEVDFVKRVNQVKDKIEKLYGTR